MMGKDSVIFSYMKGRFGVFMYLCDKLITQIDIYL